MCCRVFIIVRVVWFRRSTSSSMQMMFELYQAKCTSPELATLMACSASPAISAA